MSFALSSLLALVALPAYAADVYTGPIGPAGGYKDGYLPVVTWTGFYLGVNGGYAFDSWNRHGGMEDNGGFGGGQIGYNWQGGFGLGPNLVLGVETDFQGAGIDHSRSGTIHWDNGTIDNDLHHRSIDDFGTVRGRIGYASGPLLAYFTGGFAYGDKENQFEDLGPSSKAGNVYKDSGLHAGYVLGGGIEYKFNPAWSFKAEYQFIDLGHDDATGPGGYVHTKDTELDTVRGGINYHFNSPFDPLK
jgi:outer membrane immunogenic protein